MLSRSILAAVGSVGAARLNETVPARARGTVSPASIASALMTVSTLVVNPSLFRVLRMTPPG